MGIKSVLSTIRYYLSMIFLAPIIFVLLSLQQIPDKIRSIFWTVFYSNLFYVTALYVLRLFYDFQYLSTFVLILTIISGNSIFTEYPDDIINIVASFTCIIPYMLLK